MRISVAAHMKSKTATRQTTMQPRSTREVAILSGVVRSLEQKGLQHSPAYKYAVGLLGVTF